MGAPKGSKNALGNKGGGRKPLYIEAQVEERIREAFEDGFDIAKIKEIQELMKKGKGKINYCDLVLARAIKSDKMLSDILKKIVADKSHLKHEGEVPVAPVKIEIVKPDDK